MVVEGVVAMAGTIVPTRTLVAGIPMHVVREIDGEKRAHFEMIKRVYVELATSYDARLERIETER